ncbi:MAG: ATP-binding cassette domain-containing protein [Candidatus Delongbacteria bacterium]|nr:ATP-binding cassette domain-containing protein [Candidatus Delongbacteria bacterium]
MTLKISNFKLSHPADQNILIDDLNLVANFGDIIGVIGPNGSGKTLFFDSIAGLNPSWNGNITLNNKNIDLGAISYSVQDLNNSFFTETVEEEIIFNLQNIDTIFTLEQIIADLNFLGIDYENIKKLSPYALSSIEYKILMFTLSLLKPHKIRLIDELDSGMLLDTKNKLSQFLNRERENIITLVISHDKIFFENLCSKIVKF